MSLWRCRCLWSNSTSDTCTCISIAHHVLQSSIGLGLFGYAEWKSDTNSDAFPSSVASNHEVSSSVPSYPDHRMRYRS
jgi:hypothetical protein